MVIEANPRPPFSRSTQPTSYFHRNTPKRRAGDQRLMSAALQDALDYLVKYCFATGRRRLARAALSATCVLLLYGTASAQIPGPGVSSNIGFSVGPNYHATNADFINGAFIKRYHIASVRSAVIGQLQTMANSGASVVKTTLWQVGGSVNESWRLSFPLSNQELQNIQRYTADVAATRRPNGSYLDLQLTLAWLGCADYTLGSPSTRVGYCNYSWGTFADYAEESIYDLVWHIAGITRPDGREAVSKLYLELEVMIGAKANQDSFLFELYPFFLDEASQAGLDGSIYFMATPSEAEILDNGYQDAVYPELDGHRSMYWLYRSVDFLARNGLPLPDRLDFSFYPDRQTVPYSKLVNRVFNDFETVFPDYRAGVAETYYFADPGRRLALAQAFAAAYLARGLPEQVTFWTTPYGGATADASPPFDIASFQLKVPAGTSSSISASPNPCVIPSGQTSCTTTVTWSTNIPSATAAVWVTTGSGQPTLVGCGKSGQASFPSIRSGVASTFSLYATYACDASSTVVTGVRAATVQVTASGDQGTISASPNPCILGSGPTCTTTISWNATTSSTTAQVFVRQGTATPQLFACLKSGQQQAGWIQRFQQYTFTLHAAPNCSAPFPQTAPLASVVATARQP
jgi:hypothetical protein